MAIALVSLVQMSPCRLRNWCSFRRFSRSLGDEREYLTGEVYGDPKRPDGTRIVTTAITERDGAVVVTMSGDRYVLDGQAEPTGTDASDATHP